jgi:hypothetical protein
MRVVLKGKFPKSTAWARIRIPGRRRDGQTLHGEECAHHCQHYQFLHTLLLFLDDQQNAVKARQIIAEPLFCTTIIFEAAYRGLPLEQNMRPKS